MLVAGIDTGQQSVKAVLLEDSEMVAHKTYETEIDSDTAAREALEDLLKEVGADRNRVKRIAATGLGRKEVSFADLRKTQETCVARGAYFLLGRPCTALDAGAGGCRAVKIGPQGKVLEFSSNSKCASGTGSFLKAACEVLQIDLDRLDDLSGRAEDIAKVSTTCAVFAESAIISNVHYGYTLESICAGVCDSVASRLMDALNRVGIEEELFFCGGVAKSKTIKRMIEHLTGRPVLVPSDPLLTAALGAALSAV
ncbi:MAG: hypothetical protein HY788_09340 [Deltaproteobacteria bacterium]|nr:hypothetical protein [Deltaproteobacteria bacterium]